MDKQKFLENLKALFPQDASLPAEQVALNKAIVDTVSAKLAVEGATTTDIFAGIQDAVNAERNKLEALRIENEKELDQAQKQLTHAKKTTSIALGTETKMTAISAALNTLNGKGQDIEHLASDAGIESGKGPLHVDFTYNAEIVTQATKTVTTKDLSAKPYHVDHASHEINRHVTEPFTHAVVIKGKFDTHVVLPTVTKDGVPHYQDINGTAYAYLHSDGFKKHGMDLNELTFTDPKTHQTITIPAQHIEPGFTEDKLATVALWLQNAARLKNGKSVVCDYTRFDNPQIRGGMELPVPANLGPIYPQRHYIECTTCTIDTGSKTGKFNTSVALDATPTVKPVETKYVEFARQNASSTNGAEYRPGTLDHALELLGRSNLDPHFTHDVHYPIHEVKTGQAVTSSGASGEGRGAKVIETPGAGEKRYNPNGDDYVERMALGETGRVYSAGEINHTTDDGSLVRNTQFVGRVARGSTNVEAKVFNLIPVYLGPVIAATGASVARPSSETPLFAVTGRKPVIQDHVTMAAIEKNGFNNMFIDQASQVSVTLETSDRVYAYMYALNAKKHVEQSMHAFDDAKTPEAKQQAAHDALVAWRDYSDNALIRRVDAMKEPIEVSGRGLRQYMKEQGVDVAKIDADLYDTTKNPRLVPQDMPLEEVKKLQGYTKNNTRYKGIGTDPNIQKAYSAAIVQLSAFRSTNIFEQEMASGKFKDPTEQEMRDQSETIVKQIAGNAKARDVIIDRLNTDRNLQTIMTQLVGDIHKNPDNYFTKDELKKGEDTKMFDALIPAPKETSTQEGKDAKQARKDVKRRDHSSPTFLIPDPHKPYATPEIDGPELAKHLAEHPELMQKLLERASDNGFGNDSKGLSDGRRFGTGILRAFGAEMVPLKRDKDGNIIDGVVPEGYKKLEAALGDQYKDQLHNAVRSAVIYGEAGATNRSVQGAELGDNQMRDVQVTAKTKQLSTIEQFDLVYNKNDLGQKDVVNQNAVQGLRSHPLLASDAFFLTLAKHPEAFDQLPASLRAESNAPKGSLQSMIADVKTQLAKYHQSGSIEDLQQASMQWQTYYAKLEAHGTRRDGERREIASNEMIDAAAHNPAFANAVIETVRGNEQLMQAMLRAHEDIVQQTDGTRGTEFSRNMGHGQKIVGAGNDHIYGGQPYESLFGTLPTDKDGKVVTNTGILGFHHHKVTVNSAQTAALVNAVGNVKADETRVINTSTNSSADRQFANLLGNNFDVGKSLSFKHNAPTPYGTEATVVLLSKADTQRVRDAKTPDEALTIEGQALLDFAQKKYPGLTLGSADGLQPIDVAKGLIQHNHVVVTSDAGMALKKSPSAASMAEVVKAVTGFTGNTTAGNTLNTNPLIHLSPEDLSLLSAAKTQDQKTDAKAQVLFNLAKKNGIGDTLADGTPTMEAIQNVVGENRVNLNVDVDALTPVQRSGGVDATLSINYNKTKGVATWMVYKVVDYAIKHFPHPHHEKPPEQPAPPPQKPPTTPDQPHQPPLKPPHNPPPSNPPPPINPPDKPPVTPPVSPPPPHNPPPPINPPDKPPVTPPASPPPPHNPPPPPACNPPPPPAHNPPPPPACNPPPPPACNPPPPPAHNPPPPPSCNPPPPPPQNPPPVITPPDKPPSPPPPSNCGPTGPTKPTQPSGPDCGPTGKNPSGPGSPDHGGTPSHGSSPGGSDHGSNPSGGSHGSNPGGDTHGSGPSGGDSHGGNPAGGDKHGSGPSGGDKGGNGHNAPSGGDKHGSGPDGGKGGDSNPSKGGSSGNGAKDPSKGGSDGGKSGGDHSGGGKSSGGDKSGGDKSGGGDHGGDHGANSNGRGDVAPSTQAPKPPENPAIPSQDQAVTLPSGAPSTPTVNLPNNGMQKH